MRRRENIQSLRRNRKRDGRDSMPSPALKREGKSFVARRPAPDITPVSVPTLANYISLKEKPQSIIEGKVLREDARFLPRGVRLALLLRPF
jgi:hypothetical protein